MFKVQNPRVLNTVYCVFASATKTCVCMLCMPISRRPPHIQYSLSLYLSLSLSLAPTAVMLPVKHQAICSMALRTQSPRHFKQDRQQCQAILRSEIFPSHLSFCLAADALLPRIPTRPLGGVGIHDVPGPRITQPDQVLSSNPRRSSEAACD